MISLLAVRWGPAELGRRLPRLQNTSWPPVYLRENDAKFCTSNEWRVSAIIHGMRNQNRRSMVPSVAAIMLAD